MSPAIRTVVGTILLVVGVVDLFKFGWEVIIHSPALIIGILFTAGGAALLSSGNRSKFLP